MDATNGTGSRTNQIIIALLGLTGVITTGVFSNWDKMFPKSGVIQTVYSGYEPTGDFETELRYYLEVSGFRKWATEYPAQFATSYENSLIAQQPKNAKAIHDIMDIAREQSPKYDDLVQMILPIYQKYYSIEELQELNKFYSTRAMQEMVKKLPLISQELAPIQSKLMQEQMGKLQLRLKELLAKEEPSKEPVANPPPEESSKEPVAPPPP